MTRSDGAWCDVTTLPSGEVAWAFARGTAVVCQSAETGATRWEVTTGRDMLYLRASADGQGRVCAVGVGHDDQAAAVFEGQGPIPLGPAFGNFAVEIDGLTPSGWRVYVQRSSTTYSVLRVTEFGDVIGDETRTMPATSQGFLDIRAGVLITSDAGRHAHGLVLPNVTGGVWVGQLPNPNGLALYDETTRRQTTLFLGESQPPHITVNSLGVFHVCAWRPQGAWVQRYVRPFAADPPDPDPPDPDPDPPDPPDPDPDPGDDIVRFTVPPDIYLGAIDQFIAHVLPRDRIPAGVSEDGSQVDVTMVRGGQMYFNPQYYGAIQDWVSDHQRAPRPDEWGHVSMLGLIRAKALYDRDQRGSSGGPPPDPPDGPGPPPPAGLDRIEGQLAIEADGGYVVNGRPVLPTLCHFGDALSRWSRGHQPDVLRLFDAILAAGYHGIRFWSTIGGDSDFWHGRGVGPTETPQYWDHLQALLEALRDRGLVCQLSQGDVRPNVIPDRRAFADEVAERVGRVGPHVVALFEGANESRDTGEPDAGRLAQFVSWFRERRPEPLCALSSFTGTEDPDILDDFSRAPADVFVCHGYRGGHWWDKVRHIFSLQYEGKPAKRLGWQGEPAGPGSRVSAIDHRDELDADALSTMAAMALMTRQAWVYFSGPGVISDEGEALDAMPGFAAVPRVRALIPADVMRYDELFHGGESWAQKRVFAAQGDVRADHTYYRDGRFVCLVYGPGNLDVPQTRAAIISVDHRFGDKGRLIVGQAT